eukprot:1557261-Amphidinium_carterae.1
MNARVALNLETRMPLKSDVLLGTQVLLTQARNKQCVGGVLMDCHITLSAIVIEATTDLLTYARLTTFHY